MSAPGLFRWDWREQPPMSAIAEKVTELSGRTVHMIGLETGSDEYAMVVTNTVDVDLAIALWTGHGPGCGCDDCEGMRQDAS